MVSYLNDAVERFQLVLARCPVEHPDHAAALTNLAWARLGGYIRNDLQDIDTTTSLFCEALALCPQSHPDHPLSLYHLTFALNWRYSKEHTAVYIHESLQLCCKLLPICPDGTYLRSVGADSEINYVIGECSDLPVDVSDEGIRLQRVVLELYPLGQKYRPKTLHKLSKLLITRFRQRGSIDDIDESIRLRREAVFQRPKGHSDCGTYLNDLASSLESRFNHQGKSHDLDEVISIHEEVLLLRPAGHIYHDGSLNNLGGALRTRFIRYGDVDDINRAVSLYCEALMLRPPGNPCCDMALNNLALALNTRYDKLRVIEDLNEAIDICRESLRLKQVDHPESHIILFTLSSALCSRFIRTEKNEDIEEAIRLCQESLVALPSLHPDRHTSYRWLQEGYLSRYRVQRDPADLSLAVENFRLASGHPAQGFPYRIKTALNWVHEAESHQHDSALEAYQTCLELFDNHEMTRSSAISRREAAINFAGAQSLPVDAASCVIRSNDLQRAVELVEQGRGQQWSLASRLRTPLGDPLEDLKSASPQLSQTLAELSKRLSDTRGSAGSADKAAADQAATDYRRHTRQWEAAVTEIRNLQGFSRFLLPPSYRDLQAAACHGPVILLIASKYSCSAIIVPASGQPRHVRFPRITFADLEQLKDGFATAIRHTARMHPQQPRKKLRVRLRILWDDIMLPIVNVLQHDLKLQHKSRIWLCPTAAFTSIPLHAANPFRMNTDCSGKESCLEDLYICSYTPILSALIRARQAMKMRVTPSFAAIGQSEPGAGQGDVFPAVDSELELVHTLVPNIKFTNLSKDEATQDGALNALRCNTWVHPQFAYWLEKGSDVTKLSSMFNSTQQIGQK